MLPIHVEFTKPMQTDALVNENDENRSIGEDLEHNSTYETASVASDLTRMCVSDEEDKIIFLQKND